MLASTLPYSESNLRCLALDQSYVHVYVADIFREGAARPSDGNDTGLDGNFDARGDFELFCLEDVPHLKR